MDQNKTVATYREPGPIGIGIAGLWASILASIQIWMLCDGLATQNRWFGYIWAGFLVPYALWCLVVSAVRYAK